MDQCQQAPSKILSLLAIIQQQKINHRKNNINDLMVTQFDRIGVCDDSLVCDLNILNYESYFRIIFLTFRVCEGALGLSILVSIIRTHGNDYFQSFRII